MNLYQNEKRPPGPQISISRRKDEKTVQLRTGTLSSGQERPFRKSDPGDHGAEPRIKVGVTTPR